MGSQGRRGSGLEGRDRTHQTRRGREGWAGDRGRGAGDRARPGGARPGGAGLGPERGGARAGGGAAGWARGGAGREEGGTGAWLDTRIPGPHRGAALPSTASDPSSSLQAFPIRNTSSSCPPRLGVPGWWRGVWGINKPSFLGEMEFEILATLAFQLYSPETSG